MTAFNRSRSNEMERESDENQNLNEKTQIVKQQQDGKSGGQSWTTGKLVLRAVYQELHNQIRYISVVIRFISWRRI